MFRRVPGPAGYPGGDRLGLWEFQSENGATERLQKSESKNSYSGPAVQEFDAFRRLFPNFTRQIDTEK